MNLLLKARGAALKTCRSHLHLSNHSFNLSLECLPPVCLSVCLVALSAYLPACVSVSLLVYPPVCLPSRSSTCLYVAAFCRNVPRGRRGAGGGVKAESESYKGGGFRAQRTKGKCLSEIPPSLLCRTSPPARLSASLLMEFSKGGAL